MLALSALWQVRHTSGVLASISFSSAVWCGLWHEVQSPVMTGACFDLALVGLPP